MAKANEWKEHKSGRRPFPEDTLVDYRLRSGVESTKRAGDLDWSLPVIQTNAGGSELHLGDIVEYRKHVDPDDVDDAEDAAS